MLKTGDKVFIKTKNKIGMIIDVYTGENAGYTVEFDDEEDLYDCLMDDVLDKKTDKKDT